MNHYRWLTNLSQIFLDRDYLIEGESVDERVDIICNTAEQILKKPGFAKRFKENFQKGWYSFSTPIWTNFGNNRGLPISCFGSYLADNMESIAFTWAEVCMMTKHGGGTSAYFGNLRPRGSKIKNNGESSGSVHFMQAFDNLINIVSQGKCYIEGTQVLTDSGFKDFRDVKLTDKLAELDEYNNISFTSNYQMVVEDFDGDLVCLSGPNGSTAVKVTPNHRMVISNRDTESSWSYNSEIVLAKNLKLHKDNGLILAGWAGDGERLTDVDRLRVAFHAVGIKNDANNIQFRLYRLGEFGRLIRLLDRMGLFYEVNEHLNAVIDVTVEFVENIKLNTLKECVQFSDISGVWAEDFINELMYWNNTIIEDGSIVYNSFNRDDIDTVQTVASLAYKKTHICQHNKHFPYSIRINEDIHRSGDTVETTHEYYNGKVYCAVVPKGRLLVRYQDQVMVCGNTRRGNFAAYLDVDHPDIMEFLQLRSEGDPIQDLSFGVCIPDYWMEDMIGDGTSTGGDYNKRIVWAKILESRANIGFPFVVFIDTANKNTVDCYKDKQLKITHSNLCSEILLPNSEDESFVCDLSSMNILYYDEWKNTDAVELLTYFLDAVMTEFIEKASLLPFMERTVKFSKRHRALGIGWFGWHSYLQSKMIPLESLEAQLLNLSVAKSIQTSAHNASKKMAEEYGEPESCKGYGRRNSTLTAIAPTKSSAFIIGQASEGIEPHRTNYYIKDLQKGKFTIKNLHLEKLLQEKGKDTEDTWSDILIHGGSVQHLDFLNENEKAVFKTFAEISPLEIITQAAMRQKYVDQSQSLNLMIHPSIPTKDVNALMIESWKSGVKSLYYQISVNAAQNFSRNILSCAACEG